jgi:MFS family permease
MPVLISAVIMALAGIGDALIYPILPLHAERLGIPIIWIGVLLSINKFVRLGANHGIAVAIGRIGYKPIAISGVLLASASTFAYGLEPPLWIWVVSRLLWGVAFASVRLCALGYATEDSRQGLRLGLNRAIKELGPTSALFLGPLLVSLVGADSTFLIYGGITLLALPLALALPSRRSSLKVDVSRRFPRPNWFDGLIFNTAIVEGVVIVTVGLLLLADGVSQATVLAASSVFLGVRRLSVTVLGPLSGWLADRWRIQYVFMFSIAGILTGLVFISFGWVMAGIGMLFLCDAINQALSPGVSIIVRSSSRLNSLSAVATWRDFGSACGALLGGFLLVRFGATPLYGALAVLVLLFALKTLPATLTKRAAEANVVGSGDVDDSTWKTTR